MLYANSLVAGVPVPIRTYSPVLKIKEDDAIYNCYVGLSNKNALYFCVDKRIQGSDLNMPCLINNLPKNNPTAVDKNIDVVNPEMCNLFNDMVCFKIKSIEQLASNKIAILYSKDSLNVLYTKCENTFSMDRPSLENKEATDIVLFERARSGKLFSYVQTEQGSSVWFSEKPEKEFKKTGHKEFDTLATLFGAEE
jgi:hypothetical protein